MHMCSELATRCPHEKITAEPLYKMCIHVRVKSIIAKLPAIQIKARRSGKHSDLSPTALFKHTEVKECDMRYKTALKC